MFFGTWLLNNIFRGPQEIPDFLAVFLFVFSQFRTANVRGGTMNSHFVYLEQRVRVYVAGAITRIQQGPENWMLQNILRTPVFLLLIVFFYENDAIGAFARRNGLARKTLAEIESAWLMSEDGARQFRLHHDRFFRMVRQLYSEQEWLSARLYAQFVLFHENTHYALVESESGRIPTELDLRGGEKFLARLSLRLLLLIYSPADFNRQLQKEIQSGGLS